MHVGEREGTTDLWNDLTRTLRRSFLIESYADPRWPDDPAADMLYGHHRTGKAGFLALRGLPAFPRVGGLLSAAGLSVVQAAWLSKWASLAPTMATGVLLRVGPEQTYYWRANAGVTWPAQAVAWPTEQALGCTNGRWESRSAFDSGELANCLISDDGFPF